MNKWENYLHKEGTRMRAESGVKIMDKRSKMRCSVAVIAVLTGIMFLAPLAQVVAAQDELGEGPVAVIEGTLLIYVDHEVYLDGGDSYDPAGSPIDYRWKLMYRPEGSVAVMTDETDAQASFTCDEVGIYQVRLIVNNGFRNSRPVYATITCIDRPYFW
jgi:hypothetical protein